MSGEFDPYALMEAMAPLLGFDLGLATREQIAVHLRIAAEQAAKLLKEPLDDADEPGPVFTA